MIEVDVYGVFFLTKKINQVDVLVLEEARFSLEIETLLTVRSYKLYDLITVFIFYFYYFDIYVCREAEITLPVMTLQMKR